MMKLLQFTFLAFFSLSNTLFAGKDDLLIKYELPPQKRQIIFEKLIKNTNLKKKKVEGYHVTLIRVENVQPENRIVLQNRLNEVARPFFNGLEFTPHNTIYLKDNKNSGVLALLPLNDEQLQYKKINELLIREVAQFDHEQGTLHAIHSYTQQVKYKPHVTIAQANFIEKHKLNTENIVRSINQKMGIAYKPQGEIFEGLNLEIKKQALPLPKVQAPVAKKELAPKGVKAAPQQNKVAKAKKVKKVVPVNNPPAKQAKPKKAAPAQNKVALKKEVVKPAPPKAVKQINIQAPLNEKKENLKPGSKKTLGETLVEKGNDLLKQRSYGEAHRAFADALDELSPEHPIYTFALEQQKIARKPIAAEASVKRGHTLVKEGKIAQALDCFNRALSNLDPQDPLYQNASKVVEQLKK